MGLDQAEQLYSSLYSKFTYYSKITEEPMTALNQRWATVPLHLGSEFITKLWFNIQVHYESIRIFESYIIAKIILIIQQMFLILNNYLLSIMS